MAQEEEWLVLVSLEGPRSSLRLTLFFPLPRHFPEHGTTGPGHMGLQAVSEQPFWTFLSLRAAAPSSLYEAAWAQGNEAHHGPALSSSSSQEAQAQQAVQAAPAQEAKGKLEANAFHARPLKSAGQSSHEEKV